MRVICTVDDAVQRRPPFLGEHGLAPLIVVESDDLLFDTSQSGMAVAHALGG